ncbi:MAG: hypothetical protein PHD76_01010 [Methylacidiphilales bacterium]|nr:hypothetical protein [Candidatus Methylacidiphilales bacterium]
MTKHKLDPFLVEKEKNKLLKIMILLAKVYKKGAKNKEQKRACSQVADDLKALRKKS